MAADIDKFDSGQANPPILDYGETGWDETNRTLVIGGTTENFTQKFPKKYVALLAQSGTDAPVATVLENTLGGTVVWTYSSAGVYVATLTGLMPANKTTVTINNVYTFPGSATPLIVTPVKSGDNDFIGIYTFTVAKVATDWGVSRVSITITVYP